MPITGEWAGQAIWSPAVIPAVKVGQYGAATATIHTVPRSRSMDGKARIYAELVIPNGGLNQWTADELRAYAASLVAVADDMNTHPLGATTLTPA